VREALAGLPGVAEVMIDGRAFHARVERGATAVPAILAALDAIHLPVASVTVARPSLDDVYLRYAGRAYSAAGGKETTR
jgi:ABC-2 type transport system ATP-binding protein